jgi:hypothetical protein
MVADTGYIYPLCRAWYGTRPTSHEIWYMMQGHDAWAAPPGTSAQHTTYILGCPRDIPSSPGTSHTRQGRAHIHRPSPPQWMQQLVQLPGVCATAPGAALAAAAATGTKHYAPSRSQYVRVQRLKLSRSSSCVGVQRPAAGAGMPRVRLICSMRACAVHASLVVVHRALENIP